jgi:hypothetical protein
MLGEQTKMAFMQEGGGLRDDGMKRDPVSGNDIPSGSLAEEVRDDIPAMLSDGEYVVPADVVRFYGVKFFEDLRKKAKIGLAKMEEDGRIGGEPIAEESEEMMSPEEEQLILAITPEMNKGGVIKAAEGVMTDADIYKDAKLKAINPSNSDFSFVGGSLFDDNVPTGTTTRTYYHPDGRIQVVLYDANGNLVNPSDAEYTESPWSLTKPEAGSQDNLEATQPQDPVDTRDTGVQGFIEDRDRGIAKPFEEYSPLDFGDAAKSFDGTLASVAKFTPLGAIAGISLEQGQEVADSILKSKQYKGRPLTNYEILQLERYKSTPKPENFLTNILNRLTGKEVEEESNKEDILTFEDKDGNLVSDTYANLLEKEEFQIPPFLDDKTIMNRSQLRDGQVPTEKGQKPTAQRQFETTGHALTKYGNVQFMPNDTGVRDMDLIRMEGADGKAQYIRRYELKKMLGKDRITSTDILNLDPSKIIRKPAGDDFYEDTLFGEYGQKLDNLLGVNRTDPEYKDDTPVVYESEEASSDKSSSKTPKFVTPKAGADLSGGSTKAAETTMKIAQQNKETKAEKQARQDRIKKAQDKYKAEQQKDKDEKNVDQKIAGQITGKGYTGGSGFTKGGLASKPKPKPKKKRTTKGLGTKPKAT